MRNITDAAEELQISRQTMYARMKELNIQPTKEGKNRVLSDIDFERIKERVNCEVTIGNIHVHQHVNEHVQEHVNIRDRTRNIIEQDRHTEGYVSIREYEELKAKLEELESKLESSYTDRIQSLENQLKQKDIQLATSSDEIKGLIIGLQTSIQQLPTAQNESVVTLDARFEGVATMEEPKKPFWSRLFSK